MRGCAPPPETFGSAPSACSSCALERVDRTPSFWSTGTVPPSGCAEQRAQQVRGLDLAVAAAAPRATGPRESASWPLIVSLSSRMAANAKHGPRRQQGPESAGRGRRAYVSGLLRLSGTKSVASPRRTSSSAPLSASSSVSRNSRDVGDRRAGPPRGSRRRGACPPPRPGCRARPRSRRRPSSPSTPSCSAISGVEVLHAQAEDRRASLGLGLGARRPAGPRRACRPRRSKLFSLPSRTTTTSAFCAERRRARRGAAARSISSIGWPSNSHDHVAALDAGLRPPGPFGSTRRDQRALCVVELELLRRSRA